MLGEHNPFPTSWYGVDPSFLCNPDRYSVMCVSIPIRFGNAPAEILDSFLAAAKSIPTIVQQLQHHAAVQHVFPGLHNAALPPCSSDGPFRLTLSSSHPHVTRPSDPDLGGPRRRTALIVAESALKASRRMVVSILTRFYFFPRFHLCVCVQGVGWVGTDGRARGERPRAQNRSLPAKESLPNTPQPPTAARCLSALSSM